MSNFKIPTSNFKTPGYKEYKFFKEEYRSNVPADNAWNPNLPEGKQQLAAYVIVDFVPFKVSGRSNYIYILEFDYTQD